MCHTILLDIASGIGVPYCALEKKLLLVSFCCEFRIDVFHGLPLGLKHLAFLAISNARHLHARSLTRMDGLNLQVLLHLHYHQRVHQQHCEEVLGDVSMDLVDVTHVGSDASGVGHESKENRPSHVRQPLLHNLQDLQNEAKIEWNAKADRVAPWFPSVDLGCNLPVGITRDENGEQKPLDPFPGRVVDGVQHVWREAPNLGVQLADVFLERSPDGHTHQIEYDGVHEAGYDGHALQGFQRVRTAGLEEDRGARPLSEGPEDALQHGRLLATIRGQAVDDQRPAVGARHEVQEDRNHRHDGKELLELVALSVRRDEVEPHVDVSPAGQAVQPVQGLRSCFPAQGGVARDARQDRLPLHLYSRPADDAEPQERVDARDDQGVSDEVPDGAALGDLGDEHTDERAPGDPPAPVEDGPVVHPAGCFFSVGRDAKLGESVGVEAELDEPLQVVADALDEHVEQVPRVIIKEHDQHDEHADREADLAQATDADFQPSHDRDRGHSGDPPDGDDLVGDVVLDVAVQACQAAGETDRPDSEAGAYPKHGRHDGQHVDRIPEDAVDLVADEGVETGAHRHGQAPVVGHVAEQETNQHVHDPTVDPPVEEGQVDGILSSLVIRWPVGKYNNYLWISSTVATLAGLTGSLSFITPYSSAGTNRWSSAPCVCAYIFVTPCRLSRTHVVIVQIHVQPRISQPFLRFSLSNTVFSRGKHWNGVVLTLQFLHQFSFMSCDYSWMLVRMKCGAPCRVLGRTRTLHKGGAPNERAWWFLNRSCAALAIHSLLVCFWLSKSARFM